MLDNIASIMDTPFQSTTNRCGKCKRRCNKSKHGEITTPITVELDGNVVDDNPSDVEDKRCSEIFLENQVIFIAHFCKLFNRVNHDTTLLCKSI